MKVGDTVRLKKPGPTTATITKTYKGERWVVLDAPLLKASGKADDWFSMKELEVVPENPVKVQEDFTTVTAIHWGVSNEPENIWSFDNREQARQVAEAILRFLEQPE